MQQHEPNPEILRLIDQAFNRTDDPDATPPIRLNTDAPADLSDERDRLSTVTRAMSGWSVPEPPGDLTERVLARVGVATSVGAGNIRFEDAVAENNARSRGGLAPFLSIKELVAVAASLAIVVGVMMPGHKYAREHMRRAECMSNMQGVMAGLGGYQAAYAGALPFAGATPQGARWLRTSPGAQPAVSNTRHIFLLVRHNYVAPSAFVCPSRPDGLPMRDAPPQVLKRLRDFPNPASCSYSTQHQSGQKPTVGDDPNIVVVGDTNPLFDPRAQRLAPTYVKNSFNHFNGGGQNVLYRDGHVLWAKQPTVGVNGDHIYRAGDKTEYVGNEAPVGETDSFLIP